MTIAHDTPTTSTPKRPSKAVIFLVAAVLLVAAAWLVRILTAPPTIVAVDSPDRVAPSFIIPAEVDRLIAAYEERITQHTDSSDYRILGFLYLEKGRMSGDAGRYLAAEAAFEKAIELNQSEPTARVGLASAQYSLHRFAEAEEKAGLVYEAVGRLDALAVMSDAAFALGEYEQGQDRLTTLSVEGGEVASMFVRQAEWARLDGRGEEAMGLALQAVEETAESQNPSLRAWYLSFAAQMALYLGEYAQGQELIAEALAANPDSLTAQVTAARLDASTGELDAAIETYENVVETTPDPTFLAELGDLYLLTDQPARAEETFATVEVAATVAEADNVYDRVFAQFLADHGLDSPRAVEIAEAELGARQDVGAWDTLAWALYSAGRYDEAAEAAEKALALGTLDARFPYHAGMIAAARGEDEKAFGFLKAALDLSPEFQPLQADVAEAALQGLR